MSTAPKETWTAEDYLAFERTSAEKHEYLNGDIFLMTGASANHNLIVGNIYASLHAQLRQRPCVVYPSDMRLKISQTGLYTYPDISVVCDTPQFEDDVHDTLLNPTVIVEVLSPSTEQYDRGRKFQHYRTLATLQEYLLVSQVSPRIEQYVRQENDQWLFSDVTEPESLLELPSIVCTLLLSDVYHGLEVRRTSFMGYRSAGIRDGCLDHAVSVSNLPHHLPFNQYR